MQALRHLRERPWLGLLLVALATQMPFWFEPYGFVENNLGAFMGTFVRNWQEHGFWELRGAPLGVTLLEDPAASKPYFNHPAGLSWIFYLASGREWAVRAVLTFFLWMSAMALHGLLRERIDAFTAWAAAASLLVVPIFAFDAGMSYEGAVVACGLCSMWGLDRLRQGHGSRLSNFVLITTASLLGPLLDWTYGLWCLGIAVFAWTLVSDRELGPQHQSPPISRRFIDWIGTLVPTAVPAAVGLGIVFAWLSWSKQAPFLEGWRKAQEGQPQGVSKLIEDTILKDRPAFADWCEASLDIWVQGATWIGLAVAALGLAHALRRMPGLFTALVIPVLLHIVLFARYATFHPMQHGHGGPAFALLVGTFLHSLGRLLPQTVRTVALRATAALLLGVLAWSFVEHRLHNRTAVFERFGRTLSEAAGEGDETFFVLHNWQFYGTYVGSPRVFEYPFNSPVDLQNALDAPLGPKGRKRGIRYLYLDFGDGPEVPIHLIGDRAIKQFLDQVWLEPFPFERVPELEVELALPELGETMRVREARLYTLREPSS